MATFRKITSRFLSRCKCCDVTIPKGDDCYGSKDVDGKWLIACKKCYSDGSYKKLGTPDLSGDSLSDVISKAKAAEEAKFGAMHVEVPDLGPSRKARKANMDNGDEVEDIGDDIEVPKMQLSEEELLKSLPFEERIKRTAKWFIS